MRAGVNCRTRKPSTRNRRYSSTGCLPTWRRIDMKKLIGTASAALCLLLLTGCNTVKPYDYTNFRAHPPRSILVLPPLNESTEVEGTYGYLSTVTEPLAERG